MVIKGSCKTVKPSGQTTQSSFLIVNVKLMIVLILARSFDLTNYHVKEIKNRAECIVEIYRHAGIFKNTREV